MTSRPLPRRKSIRLRGYDYSQPGAYFITICTHRRACLFGSVVGESLQLNRYGEIVRDEWLKTAEVRSTIELDTYVVMPNHLHGIVVITDSNSGGSDGAAGEAFGRAVRNSVPTIARIFKACVTRRINATYGGSVPVWQAGFYEHVIRNDGSLERIREYIVNNPAQWSFDRENPLFVPPAKPPADVEPWMV